MVEVDGEVDDEEEDEEELQEYNFVIDCIPENTNMLPRRFYENFSEVFYELLDIPPHLNTAGLGSDQDQRYHNILLGKIEFKHHRLDIKSKHIIPNKYHLKTVINSRRPERLDPRGVRDLRQFPSAFEPIRRNFPRIKHLRGNFGQFANHGFFSRIAYSHDRRDCYLQPN